MALTTKLLDDGQTVVVEGLHPGEPFLVLRGQDRLAPDVLRLWTAGALAHGAPQAKADEVKQTVLAMEAWPDRKWPD